MKPCNSLQERYLQQAGPGRRGVLARLRGAVAHSSRAFLASLVLAVCVSTAGCEKPDSVDDEKSRDLSADERYLVELYLKINDLEKNLQMNPEDSLKKWDELRASVDTARVQRALRGLENDPERWVGIYGRINELDFKDR